MPDTRHIFIDTHGDQFEVSKWDRIDYFYFVSTKDQDSIEIELASEQVDELISLLTDWKNR